jgi:hypothetical protein
MHVKDGSPEFDDLLLLRKVIPDKGRGQAGTHQVAQEGSKPQGEQVPHKVQRPPRWRSS